MQHPPIGDPEGARFRQPGAAQPGEGIAIVVDVDHLRQIVAGQQHLGRRDGLHVLVRKLTCDHRRRHGREHVPPMERYRDTRRMGNDVPGAALGGPRPEHRQQAIVRPHEGAAVDASHQTGAAGAHAGIDHGDEDVTTRHPLGQGGQQVGRGDDVETGRLVQQGDHAHARGVAVQDGLYLAGVKVGSAEIGEQQQGHDRYLRRGRSDEPEADSDRPGQSRPAKVKRERGRGPVRSQAVAAHDAPAASLALSFAWI
jgi:hypothetical protein